MNTIYLSDFKDSLEEYINVLPIIQDNFNLLLLCSDKFLLDCYLNSAIKSAYPDNYKTIQKETFNKVPFYYNFYYAIFDIANILSIFDDLISYFDQISNNKVVFQKSIKIFILNIHLLNKNQQQVFARSTDALQKNYSIVMTTCSFSKIINQISSRFSCYRIPTSNLEDIIVKYAKNNHVEKYQDIIKQTKQLNCDLYTSLIALHTGSYKNIVYDDILKLLETSKKSKNIPTILTKVRSTLYKIMIYNIPHNTICHYIHTAIFSKYGKKLSIYNCSLITKNLAALEYNILKCSKPIYHYEKFFLHFNKIINS